MDSMAIKTILAFAYSAGVSFLLAQNSSDPYIQILKDPLLYVASIVGLGLMLSVEKKDKKIEKLTTKGVFFSIFAAIAFIFFCVVVRAGYYDNGDIVERSYIFYISIVFLTSMAPELWRKLIQDTPDRLARGIGDGLEKRAKNLIGGDDNPEYPDFREVGGPGEFTENKNLEKDDFDDEL